MFLFRMLQVLGFFCVFSSTIAGGSSQSGEVSPDFRGIGRNANPTIRDIMAQGQLGGPLHPTPPAQQDPASMSDGGLEQNLAFGQAMALWNTHRYPEATELLKSYVARNPDGLWAGEAVLHLACEARFNGRLREADQGFTALLARYGASPDLASRRVAEKAKSRLAELRVLQNSKEEAKALFSELAENAEDWRHRTYASHWIQRLSREGHLGEALADCGSQALAHVLEKAGRHEDAQTVLDRLPNDARGFSLADLSRMAEGYGYPVTPLRAEAKDLAKLPYPAIAHIERSNGSGSGHFWVVEGLENDQLTLFDAQENRRFRQSLAEFSREWDGNLLLFSAAEDLPGQRVAAAEAEEIFGACCGVQRPESDLGPPDECDANSRGCPIWAVNRISLNLYATDTPLWYRPAFGPEVAITLSYNSQSAIARNEIFGNKWSFGYGGYVVEDPGNTVTVFLGNGRRVVFTRQSDGSYAPSRGSYEKLVKLDVSTYELHFRDGSVHRFAIPEGTASQQPFLTRITDPKGHALTFAYDHQVRLTTIIDAQGRQTVLEYDGNRRVVRVADPFGREARFAYDAAGNLVEIVDMGGYASQLVYDANVYLTSLTKPGLGTWRFYIEPADGIYNGSNPYPVPGGTMWENYRITVTDPLGNKEEFHYDGYHGYSWYVSPRNYAYDNPRNNYLSAPKTTYRFSRWPSRITRIRHPNGEEISNTYDYYGRNTDSSDGVATVKRTFNSAHQKISETRDPNGIPQTTSYEYLNSDTDLPTRIRRESVAAGKPFEQAIRYDDQQNPVEVAYRGYAPDGTPVERIHRYTYNNLGQLVLEDGPRTDVADETRYSYYDCAQADDGGHCGRLASVTNAAGQITRIDRYTTNGLPAQITDPNGRITRYEYDDLDRITAVTEQSAEGSARTTRYTYRGPKHLASITLPDGATLTFDYDLLGRQTAVVDRLGNRIEYGYDANGNRIEERVFDTSGTLARSVAYAYDLRDRVVKVSSGGSVTQYSHYRNHLVGRIADGNGHVTGRTYDGQGRLAAVTPPVGSPVSYRYDTHGRLIRVALNNGNGPVTAYEYDDLGNLLKEVSPDRGTIAYGYDAAGNLLSRTDARGVTAAFRYDALNRPLEASYSDGTAVAYDYDTAPNGLGRLAAITDASGSTTFAYDGFGQLAEKLQSIETDNHTVPFRIQYRYDDAGRPASIVYPSGLTVAYGYDAAGRVAQLDVNGMPWLDAIAYRPFGPVSQWQWADGSVQARDYDLAGRLIQHSLGSDTRRLDYDGAGNIVRLADRVTDLALTYDPVHRLIGVTNNDTWAWRYDGNGNRLSEQHGGLIDNYRYQAASNRLLDITGSRQRVYEYDPAGNVLSDGLYRYGYDALGGLATVDDGATARYRHNALGQRVAKFTGALRVASPDIDRDGQVTERDLISLQALIRAGHYRAAADLNGDGRLDGQDLPCMATRIGDGNNQGKATTPVKPVAGQPNNRGAHACSVTTAVPGTYFAYDEVGRLLGEYREDGMPEQETVWFDGRPIATVREGIAHAVHTDHLGTPRLVTDATGQVVWRWPDSPFGTAPAEEDPNGDGQLFSYHLRFPGQYFDQETGLYYNYFRDYDPTIGRYIQSDPIGLAGGLNSYAYVRNNPLNRIDPLGLTELYYDPGAQILSVYPEQPGRPSYFIPATSGRPNCGCDASSKNKGPIPSGKYTFNSKDVSNPSWYKDIVRNFPGLGADWGDWRAPLTPSVGTNTFGRSGFFLHGGSIPGSAGCIDVGGGVLGNTSTDQLLNDIMSDPDGSIPVTVK